MPADSITVTYTPPEHGWLTLRLTIGGREIEIDASDVPNNPVQELVLAVCDISEGRDASVWWHLEPGWIATTFEHVFDGIRLRIESYQSLDVEASKQTILASSGPNVLRPFMDFLRDFRSKQIAEDDWPEVDWRPLDQVHDSLSM